MRRARVSKSRVSLPLPYSKPINFSVGKHDGNILNLESEGIQVLKKKKQSTQPSAKQSKSKRNLLFHFMAAEEEADLIRQRMTDSGIVNKSAYLRRMAIHGYCVNIDHTPVREMTSLLRRCVNNLKQYAERAEEINSPYQDDIKELLQQTDKMWEATNQIIIGLTKIR